MYIYILYTKYQNIFRWTIMYSLSINNMIFVSIVVANHHPSKNRAHQISTGCWGEGKNMRTNTSPIVLILLINLWKNLKIVWILRTRERLFMEEILHQLIWQILQDLQGFRHLRWLFGISSINSRCAKGGFLSHRYHPQAASRCLTPNSSGVSNP